MRTNNNLYFIIITVTALLSLTAGIVSATGSTTSITYQGKLADSAGNPLTGTYSVTFNLYDSASGGTVLAKDSHSVTATDGLFTTAITFDPSLFDGRGLWLGIQIGSDAEMTPRQEIRPVPYALGLVGSVSDPVTPVVTDIQTKVNTLLADVSAIRTLLETPAKPVRYEYYTAPMFLPGGLASASIQDNNFVVNAGDTPAEVCWYKYFLKADASDFTQTNSGCAVLAAGRSKILNPTTVFPANWQERMKITTNSSYVVPTTSLVTLGSSENIVIYTPGDFQKIEIYE